MMRSATVYQERTFTIAAGDAVDWVRHGDAFGCLDASGEFYVKLDNQPRTQFRKGLTLETDTEVVNGKQVKVPFNSVRIENRGAISITLTVFATKGKLRDARLSLPGDLEAFTGSARLIVPSKAQVSSGERKLIAPANPDRLELIVTNMGVAPVFLGNTNVIWGEGIPLAPGATTSLNFQTEIHAYAQASGIQHLSILESSK